MKKYEIKAYSVKAAMDIAAQEGITVVRNVTTSYKKQNPEDFDAFAVDMLDKNKLQSSTGVGCIVVINPGTEDLRKKPYKFVNHFATGNLVKKRVFEIRTKDDDTLISRESTKREAIVAAKKVMKTLKKDLVCKQVYVVEEPHATAFELKYIPSQKAKQGNYIVFGN